MKLKHLFIIAVLAAIPLTAWAWGVVSISGGVAAPAATCDTQSTAVEQTDTGGSAGALVVNSKSVGNQFTLASGIDLYSVSIYVSSEGMDSGESGTLTIRVGSGTDLSTTYLGEATLVIANNTFAEGWYEVVFAEPIELAAGTYAYIAQWSMDSTDPLYVERSASDVYASNSALYDYSTGSFTCTVSTSFDYTFRIKKCGE